MKKIFRFMAFAVIALVTAMSLQSCLDDDDDDDKTIIDPNLGANAIVTLKTNPATGQFYMQLNDSVTVIPTNMKESPYGNKELRAIALITYKDKADSFHYSRSGDVLIIDTIRTKQMSPVVNDIAKTYGTDPLEIINDWVTVCEDGYLTLHFRTYFGNGKVHTLRLVNTGDNTVTLYHDANGDNQNNSRPGDGLIAFHLNDLPETNGQYKEITLKWNSFSGEKSVKFRYKSRD